MTKRTDTSIAEQSSAEVVYDEASDVAVMHGETVQADDSAALQNGNDAGCHAGASMRESARQTASADILDQYERDYPVGPHDQPQSMCPAFGSLRVGLRMKRTATILSGSACCVFGLTFTSHFYGAKRSVGYVPFNSETLVTGKLFEDIREAVYDLADPEKYDTIVVTNLCVPTASGVPLRLLPKEINGVRIVGIDVPGFGVPTHAEAKDVLAGAMLHYARTEAEEGPVQRPQADTNDLPKITLLGEMFPTDPMNIGRLLAPMGLDAGAVVPTREWRDLYRALDGVAVAATHPFYTASIREFKAAGRPVIGSAPVGRDGTDAWLKSIGEACGIASEKVDAARNTAARAVADAMDAVSVPLRITLSGYEGSELIVARLLVESGADLRYVGTACPHTPYSEADREWLEAHGVKVKYRASLEDDLAAFEEYAPDVAIGTTPVVQKAKETGTPALYFTNLISARPLMGAAGAGALAQVVNAASEGKARFADMRNFFEGVGADDTAGVWENKPPSQEEYRKKMRRKLEKQKRQDANLEAPTGC